MSVPGIRDTNVAIGAPANPLTPNDTKSSRVMMMATMWTCFLSPIPNAFRNLSVDNKESLKMTDSKLEIFISSLPRFFDINMNFQMQCYYLETVEGADLGVIIMSLPSLCHVTGFMAAIHLRNLSNYKTCEYLNTGTKNFNYSRDPNVRYLTGPI